MSYIKIVKKLRLTLTEFKFRLMSSKQSEIFKANELQKLKDQLKHRQIQDKLVYCKAFLPFFYKDKYKNQNIEYADNPHTLEKITSICMQNNLDDLLGGVIGIEDGQLLICYEMLEFCKRSPKFEYGFSNFQIKNNEKVTMKLEVFEQYFSQLSKANQRHFLKMMKIFNTNNRHKKT